MLDIRKRIFIALGILAGLIVVILLWYLFIRKDVVTPVEIQPVGEQNTAEDGTVGDNITTGVNQKQTFTKEELDGIYAKQIARIFVERFATYSNQNDNRHLEDALELSTDNMAKWLNTQQIKTSNDYLGVTTKVIAENLSNFTDKSTEVQVETQQVWDSAGKQEMKQQNGMVKLIKVGVDWKVDGFYWEK